MVFETDLTTENSQQSTTETQPEHLNDLLHDAPDNYFTKQLNLPEIDLPPDIYHTTPIKNQVKKNFLR